MTKDLEKMRKELSLLSSRIIVWDVGTMFWGIPSCVVSSIPFGS